ncbi:hypothetical protein MPSEU_000238300 [Mayamaea pseudoterrestris]|nr:hypothetical protein MPSEU_000238300 [Mayamaea pseudoterrestris]
MAVHVHAYRVGEAIDTDIRLDADISDALRSQRPLFGMTSSAQFLFSSTAEKSETFAMTFEDGLWTIPRTPLRNNNQEYLQSLQVDFIYSRAGSVQSVSNQYPVYNKDQPTYFSIDYKWTVEDAPHVQASMMLMVIVVFVACILFLLDAFGMKADDVSGRGSANFGVASAWDAVKEH